MKQTLEEAEKEYCEKNYPYSDLNIRLLVENAFEAGAEWQSNQSPWISVYKKMPPLGQKVIHMNINTSNVNVGQVNNKLICMLLLLFFLLILAI